MAVGGVWGAFWCFCCLFSRPVQVPSCPFHILLPHWDCHLSCTPGCPPGCRHDSLSPHSSLPLTPSSILAGESENSMESWGYPDYNRVSSPSDWPGPQQRSPPCPEHPRHPSCPWGQTSPPGSPRTVEETGQEMVTPGGRENSRVPYQDERLTLVGLVTLNEGGPFYFLVVAVLGEALRSDGPEDIGRYPMCLQVGPVGFLRLCNDLPNSTKGMKAHNWGPAESR